MKLIVSRDSLKGLLAAVGGAVPSRSTLPVLSTVLFEAEGDTLHATATDLDVVVKTQVAARIATPGALCLPFDTLRQIVEKAAPGDMELSAEGEKVTVKAGRAKLQIHGLAKEEFPAVKIPSFEAAWTLPGSILFDAIEATAFAVSTEEVRPILNGVLWDLRDGEMRMVATNGHRLAMAAVPAPQGAEAVLAGELAGQPEVIVRPRALNLARALLAGSHTIEVAREDFFIGFRAGAGMIATRLIEGPYPNYDQIIPKENDKELIADTGTFRQAVERVSILASDQTHRMRISMSPASALHLSAETPDRGQGEEDVAGAEYTGDPLDIGFSAKYVAEMLRKISTERCRWTFRAPERAAVIEPAEQKEGFRVLYLVMPLRLLD